MQTNRGDEGYLPADDGDHDVQSAQPRHGPFDHRAELIDGTDVDGQRRAVALQFRRGGVRAARVEVRNDDSRAGGSERTGDRSADPLARAADDKGTLAVQSHHFTLPTG